MWQPQQAAEAAADSFAYRCVLVRLTISFCAAFFSVSKNPRRVGATVSSGSSFGGGAFGVGGFSLTGGRVDGLRAARPGPSGGRVRCAL